MALRPGEQVSHFVIVEMLGEGGMGQVYLAKDLTLHRNVALKILHPDSIDASNPSSSTGGAARMMREARAAAALDHPNVVSIFEVGEVASKDDEPALPFIAMELVRGRSLRAYIGDESVPLARRVRWLADAARALGAAHTIGLVHRDVKPENIMVRDDGVVKVLDFGIAKRQAGKASATSSTEAQILPSLTSKGVAVGTPYYMAPEQMRREPLDGRSDQFSWGVVAYELLAGAPPWGRDVDALELVSNVLSKSPPPLDVASPSVPAHVADVVMRTLAKAREERFASMEEVAAAITAQVDAFAATMSRVPVSRPSAGEVPKALLDSQKSEPVAVPARRARTWIALAALGVVAIAGAVGYGVMRERRQAAQLASSASAAHPGCTSNRACIEAHGGAAYVCHRDDGTCAPLESEDCKVYAEPRDLENDDTVWIGTMFPLTGDDASWGKLEAQAVDLARRDFVGAMGGFTMQKGESRVRPIALVQCDDSVDASRAAKHLADDVRVPAVVGFSSGAKMIELEGELFIPRRILTVATLSISPLVTRVPQGPDQPRLIWRTTYNANATAAPVSELISRVLEPRIRREAKLRDGQAIRIAVIRPSHALVHAQGFFSTLRFNGKSAVDNGSNFREFVFDEVGGSDTTAPPLLDEIEAFAPDIIVNYGGETTAKELIGPLEARWKAARRPFYVAFTVLGNAIFDLIGASEERRRRFFGVAPISNTRANAEFALAYNAAFGTKLSRTQVPSSSYDALYLVAYAAYAAPDRGPIDGTTLARMIPRLQPPGELIEVGPAHIFDAFRELRAAHDIDLSGAIGSLDFDVRTGESPSDFTILCAHRDPLDGNRLASVDSGLLFNAQTSALEGELNCP